MNGPGNLLVLKRLSAAILDFLASDDSRTSRSVWRDRIDDARIDSAAQCSHALEQPAESAVIQLPAAIRFTHALPFQSWPQEADLENELYWSGRGLCFFLSQISESPELSHVSETAVLCLREVVNSWNNESLHVPEAVTASASRYANLFPPAAVLLNEVLEAKLQSEGCPLFDSFYADWTDLAEATEKKSGNWLLFCCCVRNNSNDHLICRAPMVRQTVFDRELVTRHLEVARNGLAAELVDRLEAELLMG
ncbi:MAG: hypothetical protein CMJ47_04310 [Planctomyces sp.]|nr:hypothetical protein [Planctomyces sp.]